MGSLAAERGVKRVRGVRAVANDIIVRLKADVTDTDIAAAAAMALKVRPGIPPAVQATVHNGHVTLTGHVEWLHQKEQAEMAVQQIGGVRGVLNHIEVAPRTVQRDVRRRIVQSLHRNADLDARHIDVVVTGDVVTLAGTVGSWSQYEAADVVPAARRVFGRSITRSVWCRRSPTSSSRQTKSVDPAGKQHSGA